MRNIILGFTFAALSTSAIADTYMANKLIEAKAICGSRYVKTSTYGSHPGSYVLSTKSNGTETFQEIFNLKTGSKNLPEQGDLARQTVSIDGQKTEIYLKNSTCYNMFGFENSACPKGVVLIEADRDIQKSVLQFTIFAAINSLSEL